VNPAKAFYMVTFEIAPEDEAVFNEIYDAEHVPNIMRVPGVLGCVRFKDAHPSERALLVYSAIYFLDREGVQEGASWKAASDTGRWATVIRPRLRSRQRRAGPIVARIMA